MSNFIRQNEVNKANELLKVQQPLLESSSEMDKFSFSRILSDREYQLTAPWSAKLIDEVVGEVPKCSILVP